MPDSTVQDFKRVKWQQVREAAVENIEEQRAHLRGVLPERDNPLDPNWMPYLQQRVLALENEALNIAARFVWTKRTDKEGMIRRYLDILRDLVNGQDKETDLHVVESIMEVACRSETRRLRAEHPEFFQ